MQAGALHELVPNVVNSPFVASRGHPSRQDINQSLLRILQKDCNDTRNRFVPRKALIEFFHLEYVERLLQFIQGSGREDPNNWQDVAKRICSSPGNCSCRFRSCTGGRMTLATLFLCGKEDLILSFFPTTNAPFCDGRLPLRFKSPDDPCYGLNDKDQELFTHFQWLFYTPFLTGLVAEQEVETFPEEVSLPWKTKEKITTEEGAEVPFVEKVGIHFGNHDLTQNVHDSFALKILEPKLADGFVKENFHREVENNLAAPEHERIVRLLTAFTYREKFYILFPLANRGSLEELWRSHTPNITSEESTPTTSSSPYSDDWLVGQCHGIAGALVATHGLAEGQSEGTISLLHADIKPENILCFLDPDTAESRVVLKLADFGEAERLKPNVALEASRVAHVKTYRPPEKDLGNIITLNYDVWCLGCLFLDFITWLILGQDGLDSFSKARVEEADDPGVTRIPGQFVRDTFFKKVKEKPGPPFYRRLKVGYKREVKVASGNASGNASTKATTEVSTKASTKASTTDLTRDSTKASSQRSLWVASHFKITSQLKHAVVSHLRSLQAHTKCSVKLRRLLSFVEQNMLVVKPEQRASSPEVYQFLTELASSS